MHRYFWLLSPLAVLMAGCATIGDDSSRLVTVDHYVRVKSTAPALTGQDAQIYVREVVLAGTGAHHKQVVPERVRELYADLGSKQKVVIDLARSSHNAMWERNRLLLFQGSLEWLKDGKVNGTSEGELKLGY